MDIVYPPEHTRIKTKRRRRIGIPPVRGLALAASLLVHAAIATCIRTGQPAAPNTPPPKPPDIRTVLQLEAPPALRGSTVPRFRDLRMPAFAFTEGLPGESSTTPGAYNRTRLEDELNMQALTNRRERPHRHVWDAYPEIEGGFKKLLNPW
jgi:hypothetical protein